MNKEASQEKEKTKQKVKVNTELDKIKANFSKTKLSFIIATSALLGYFLLSISIKILLQDSDENFPSNLGNLYSASISSTGDSIIVVGQKKLDEGQNISPTDLVFLESHNAGLTWFASEITELDFGEKGPIRSYVPLSISLDWSTGEGLLIANGDLWTRDSYEAKWEKETFNIPIFANDEKELGTFGTNSVSSEDVDINSVEYDWDLDQGYFFIDLERRSVDQILVLFKKTDRISNILTSPLLGKHVAAGYDLNKRVGLYYDYFSEQLIRFDFMQGNFARQLMEQNNKDFFRFSILSIDSSGIEGIAAGTYQFEYSIFALADSFKTIRATLVDSTLNMNSIKMDWKSGNGVIVGDDELVLLTKDRGSSWQKISTVRESTTILKQNN